MYKIRHVIKFSEFPILPPIGRARSPSAVPLVPHLLISLASLPPPRRWPASPSPASRVPHRRRRLSQCSSPHLTFPTTRFLSTARTSLKGVVRGQTVKGRIFMRRRGAAGRGSAASARPGDDTGGRRGARSTPPLTCFWANRRWICVRRQRAGGRGGDGSARMDEEALDLR
jgi:hypothetical protein